MNRPSADTPPALAARSYRPPAGGAPALAAALCAIVLACLAAAPAGAAPALGWSTIKINGVALTGISCASEALCVAVDGEGHALVGTDPGAATGWSRVAIEGAPALTAVSCASTSLCVAVDKAGDALVSTNPAAGAGSTWTRAAIDSGHALSSVSCPSTSLCVAVDGTGRALVSTDPAAGAGARWSPAEIDSGHALSSVSCAPAGSCVAVDGERDALASGNPTAEAPTWSWTPAFALAPGSPTAVSCAAAGLCVSVDSGGGAYVSDEPTATPPAWTFYGIDPGRALSGVSCVSEGLCAAVDDAGQAIVTRVPPPTAATGTPSALTETSATLTGTVNPDDALTSCHFEYGPSEAYGQSAPCAIGGVGVTDLAGGAAQAVSAALGGLVANTTYHYRLVASSASGTSVSPDATLETLAPPLVEPHPSISGIPALGQRLTCKSGVSASGVTVSYAWLRDTQAVASANGSTYTVSSADVSRHLQCRVTATNAGGSASATSSFVTVPAGGLGAISETQVGTLRVAAGGTVSVPLTCSAQAAGSCTITLRLTVVETLHGNRVVAVAAARARRATVTVSASTVHLKPSQRLTVVLTLNATGRRLLAHLRQMPVRLSVSGTVVGALSATLKSATLTLTGAGKASSHRRR